MQVTVEDRQALVTRVFAAYLALMRRVQTTYWRALPSPYFHQSERVRGVESTVTPPKATLL